MSSVVVVALGAPLRSGRRRSRAGVGGPGTVPIHEIAAFFADMEGQHGHHQRPDHARRREPASELLAPDEEGRGKQEQCRNRCPGEQLRRFFVGFQSRFGHDPLYPLLLARPCLERHEGAEGERSLQGHHDPPGSSGQATQPPGNEQGASQDRNQDGQGEGEVDDGGMERCWRHGPLFLRSGGAPDNPAHDACPPPGRVPPLYAACVATNDADLERRTNVWAVVLFAAIALLIGADLGFDYREGAGGGHVGFEATVVAIALAGLVVLARRLLALRRDLRAERDALRETADDLARRLAKQREEAERWRAEARTLLDGLGQAIDHQFERWKLSPAEREIGLLLLKGLSHQEVADVRGVSERTVRQQARALYKKAGLAGRADLAAYFLEDLLLPAAQSGEESKR
jgi:DNA-binding CsgD family transcriptional regulator